MRHLRYQPLSLLAGHESETSNSNEENPNHNDAVRLMCGIYDKLTSFTHLTDLQKFSSLTFLDSPYMTRLLDPITVSDRATAIPILPQKAVIGHHFVCMLIQSDSDHAAHRDEKARRE